MNRAYFHPDQLAQLQLSGYAVAVAEVVESKQSLMNHCYCVHFVEYKTPNVVAL